MNKVLYEKKRKDLETLEKMAKQGLCHLYYFDESGIDRNPSISYCWQEKNKTLPIPSASNRKRINMLGFLNIVDSSLKSYVIEDKVDSDVVVSIFDDFSKTLSKTTVVVLDNASFHKSKVFKQNKDIWEQRGLYLFYLPPYSPQLNPIEILWRFIKYIWIDYRAYLSNDNLLEYINDVLHNYGSKYIINFD